MPATDVDALKRDAKLSVQTIDTVYVFNIELDMRDKALNVAAKDGSPLDKNPLQDLRVREAIDLAIDRKALADGGDGRPRQAGEPDGHAVDLRLQQVAGERKYDPAAARKLLADGGYPNGFRLQFSFTQDRLPGDRQVGTSIAQMLAAIGIDAQANAQPAAVFFPARTRGEYSMSMSGWGTLTGEAHYTLSSLAHSNDKERKMGAFNVLGYKNPAMDKLLQDAAVEMDEAKRRKLPRGRERAARKGSSALADRLGGLGLGDAEGQGDDQVAGRRGHAGDEHQAGEVGLWLISRSACTGAAERSPAPS